MKKFKTIDHQIDLLQKRELTFQDIDKAKRYLLTNNYYNIINGYGKYFQDTTDHFVEGATFDEVSQLYFCDKQLKQAFFNSIITVEHHLKSIFAYRFAEEYQDQRYAYLDINAYNPDKVLSVGRIISDLSRLVNFHKNKSNDPIEHYVNKYNNVPIWIVVEFLDFGELCTLIKNSKRKIQNKICKDLLPFIKENIGDIDKHFTPDIMISFVENIRELRNICAHNNRMLNFNCRADSKYFSPLHDLYKIKDNENRRQVYSIFLSMQCFLSPTEFKILSNTVRKKLNFLNNHLDSISIQEILNALDFPKDWLIQSKAKQ